MQVANPYNNVKIYNLSAGKSLPEWLSEKKRRALIKKNADVRRRIELIQDFDMPGTSQCIRVSPDGQYILATGTYKPRVKCFDTNNLSLKFERCFDSEAVAFEVLSDDFSKLVFLQCDRYIEFHAAGGRYYRLRIPKFGRDMKYHYPTCDLLVVGASSDIYRLNLERGQFMTPFTSTASAINKCEVNPYHHLITCGTQEGKVEAWDPRSKTIVGTLDSAFHCITENKELEGFPSVTALKFDGELTLGVGTATGQILLYDIRCNRPFFVKDHMNAEAIKNIEFHHDQNLVYSMDKLVVKIWDRNNNGKLYTAIEATTSFNDLCVVKNTGMMFMATESTKMQTIYIPSLGPAPKWASVLDCLTEELEESNTEIMYDDYKFVTKQELSDLGLEHLIGTKVLRGYMHGYFMDVRLYKKAKSLVNPFNYEEFKKNKIRETLNKDTENRVQIANTLPKVNKDLALKLMNDEATQKKKNNASGLLKDDRFKMLFEDPEMEVDKEAEEYRLLNPVLSRLDKSKKKELQKKLVKVVVEKEEEMEGKDSDDEESDYMQESDDDGEAESSDDDTVWTEEVKKQHRIINREKRMKERREEEEEREKQKKDLEVVEYQNSDELKYNKAMHKFKRATLGERLQSQESDVITRKFGSKEMKFHMRSNKKDAYRKTQKDLHFAERKKLARIPTGRVGKKKYL